MLRVGYGLSVRRKGFVTVSQTVVYPTLSNPSFGTATSDGCTGANVSTNEANGTLYWAVVTDGGSCTTAQLKAGSGGNIVSGKAGNQSVSTLGAQTIIDITGLSASTTYQIKFLQTDITPADSGQVSVNLTTNSAPSGSFIVMQDGSKILTQGGDGILVQ